LKKCVDRLAILDGVIIAIGWCEGDSPEIVIDGQAVAQQTCLRYSRPDVDRHLGAGFEGTHGFRIAAVVPGLQDNSRIAVRFSNGSILKAALTSPEDRYNEVLSRFLKEVSDAPETASLIELGSRARSGNSYRSLFPSILQYTGVDVMDGPNVDVVADLHVLSKTVDSQHDFAFSISVFEHLLMPWVAAVELNSVLVDGGIAYIQSHPTYPLHDEPWDFFRFSTDAWYGIFNALTGFEILDTAYGLEASIVPVSANSEALQDIDMHRTFLLSACLIKKISEPRVDWRCDPSEVYDLRYKH
jgi:hypothetical protein